MVYRMLPLALVAVALALFLAAPALSDDKPNAQGNAQRNAQGTAQGNTHEGKVVSASGTKLVMTDRDGKEHTHTLAPNGQVMVDGRNAKIEDLRPGMRIRVTTEQGNIGVVTRIEGLDKGRDFQGGTDRGTGTGTRSGTGTGTNPNPNKNP